MNPSTLAIISCCIAALTMLFGGGTIFNSWRKNAVLEYRLDEAAKKVDEHTRQLAELKGGLALTDQRLEQITTSLKKLDLLETMSSHMTLLMARTENILPRPEAQTKFDDLGRRVHNVEEAVHELEQPK